MAPEVGDLARDIFNKVLQKNTFECVGCGHRIVHCNENKYPLFPCEECGVVDWKVYSINDNIIYKR